MHPEEIRQTKRPPAEIAKNAKMTVIGRKEALRMNLEISLGALRLECFLPAVGPSKEAYHRG
jgi:hypothetical protein